jgi:hypothetical protein
MGRYRVIAVVMLLLSMGDGLRAADCGLVNGGFEVDEAIDGIRSRSPTGWDANLPAGEFGGWVESSWPTEGAYNLMLSANWFMTFSGGEMGTVSQELSLAGVSAVVFDLKLRTSGRVVGWDPNICTAVVLIDDDVVWESNFARADIQGEYPGQVCLVDEKYKDGQPHRLALGLRINTGGMFFEIYESYWDAVECVSDPGGGVLLPGDFDADGLIDACDLMLMAGMWAVDVPADSPLNLGTGTTEDPNGVVGRINFFDLAVLANNWRGSSLVQEE